MIVYAIVEIKEGCPAEAISASNRKIAIKRFRKMHPEAGRIQICPSDGCTFDHNIVEKT